MEDGDAFGVLFERAEGEVEEGVDGLAADVDGGESGGGEDGFWDVEGCDEFSEEGGFSGAGASGDEDELAEASAIGLGEEVVEVC